MRCLAIDLGDRRTGLAGGDDSTGIVQPVGMLEVPRGPLLLEAVARRVDEFGPDAIVLGLPLNMDGSEGPRAAIARAFAEALRSRVTVPIHMQDERLTSFDAEGRLAGTGRTRGEKKALRDALAACALLEDFLRARGASA